VGESAFQRSAVFSPEDVVFISRAYGQALHILAEHGKTAEMEAKLAENIMHLARSGETDEERICALAVIRTLGRKPAEITVYTGL
jgi:hypothetical protein